MIAMAVKAKRLPHLGGKGVVGKSADVDSSEIAAPVPFFKAEPDPEDFELIGSYGLRYAGYEPRFTGQHADMGTYGGDNFLIREGIIYDRNLTGSYGVIGTLSHGAVLHGNYGVRAT